MMSTRDGQKIKTYRRAGVKDLVPTMIERIQLKS